MIKLRHVITNEIATLDEWRELFIELELPEESRAYYWSFLEPVIVKKI